MGLNQGSLLSSLLQPKSILCSELTTKAQQLYCNNCNQNMPTFKFNFSGQSYKDSMLVNYDCRVVSISNLLVITTLES